MESNALENIGKVCYYILHPGKALGIAWGFTVSASKIMCIATLVIAFILFITTNSDKAKKVSLGSPIVYMIIKTIDAMLKGVI